MTIQANTKVREIALEVPQATKLFEKFGIDYCCGGEKPLAEACATAGVEIEDVLQMLAGAPNVTAQESAGLDFQKFTLTQLIGHILDEHHVYTKAEMARLESLIEKVITAHGQNHPELREIALLFQSLCNDLKPHLFKEEQVLFPYIVALESSGPERQAPFAFFGTVNNPIKMMMTEHDTAGDILRQLRSLSSDYAVPADGCISYQTLYQALEAFKKDLHQHIHLENNILFPRAIELEGRRAA
jgi:regulator of cell morphogenesis and NO signaling